MFNTKLLATFILKRDRLQICFWLLGILGITLIIPPAFAEMFETEMERMAMAETMSNPAMIAMVGPGFGLDNYTIGAMFAHNMLLFMAIVVAFMNIFFVVRHTRADEESGRIELIRSLPTGKIAPLMATLLVAAAINITLALLTGIGLAALRIESMDFHGSLLFGAVYGMTGWLFACITAIFVQLSRNTRTVMSYAFTFLSGAYLLRAIGDVSSEPLALFSPLGLVLRTEVFVSNQWWPLTIVFFQGLIIGCFSLYLNTLRDLDAGFIAERPGRKEASPYLRNYTGLTLRLIRTSIISWAIGMFILGASYGSIFGDLEAFFESNELLQQMLADGEGLSLAEQFLPMLMVIIAIFSTIPSLLLILRVRGEEKKHRMEHILARHVSRNTILGNYVVSAVLTSIMMTLVAIIGLFVASSAVMENPIQFRTILEAGLIQVPAIWVMISFTVLLVGSFPEKASWIWLYLGYAFFSVYLGGMLDFPEWMMRLSPFGNVPQVPIETLNLTWPFILSGISILIIGVGFNGFNKRDIE